MSAPISDAERAAIRGGMVAVTLALFACVLAALAVLIALAVVFS